MKEILIGIGTLNIGGTEKHVVDIIKKLDIVLIIKGISKCGHII